MALEDKISVTEEFTGFVYTTGKGGTIIHSTKVGHVTHAAVLEISGQAAGDVELHGYVDSVSIATGTINGVDPTTNGIDLFLYSSATGTIVEEATGTIAETVKIRIDGY